MADTSNIDWGSVEQQLRNYASNKGVDYDPSDLAGIQRHTGYDVGGSSLAEALAGQYAVYDRRAGSTNNRIVDSQSAAGDALYGSGTNNPNNIPGMANGGAGNTAMQSWSQMPTPQVDPELKKRRDDLFNMLMGRAQQGLNVDRNSPQIRQQADAFSAQQDRTRRDFISDLAEGSSPYANLTGQERIAAEHAGQASGQFEASLISRELEAKRDEIAQALTAASGMLSDDQKIDLQKQLAVMNQALENRRLSLDELTGGRTYDLGLRRLGLDDWQQQMYWDAINSGRMG